jgi:hypothetical protein
MRFGLGIRPSPTISSNFVTPTPMYAAACTRDRPRRQSDSRSQLTELRCFSFIAPSQCARLASRASPFEVPDTVVQFILAVALLRTLTEQT